MKIIIILIILVLTQLYAQQIQEVSLQQQPYSEDLAKQLCAYSIAAYCPNKKIQNWSCGKPCRNYKDLEDIHIIYNKDTQIKLFFGYTSSINSIVVSFRGSLSIENFKQDLDWTLVKYPHCEGCMVENGWNKGYLSVQEEIMDTLDQYLQKYPQSKVAVTGHSLGAVISNWFVGDLILRGLTDFTWYNYESPKAGNLQFVKWITSHIQNEQFRVIHANDLAAHVPDTDQYVPTPQEIFYPDSSEPNAKHIFCSTTQEDPQCSSQYNIDQTSMFTHLDYMGYNMFNIISLCLL